MPEAALSIADGKDQAATRWVAANFSGSPRPGIRVRRHVRSWRRPTLHSKAHPLVNRLNLFLVPLLLALAAHPPQTA